MTSRNQVKSAEVIARVRNYHSKRLPGDPFKLYFWEVKARPPESYLTVPRHLRTKVSRFLYIPGIRVDVNVEDIETEEKIGQLVIDIIGYEGDFLMKGFTHGFNKMRVRNVTLCKVGIRESPYGLKAFVTDTSRLARYRFWKGSGKQDREESDEKYIGWSGR